MYQVNDDMSIYVTRGDIVNLAVTAEDNGDPYYFQLGDVVRIKVFAKKDCEVVVLQKDFPVTSVTDTVEIFLDENDTKIGEVISKPRDYWYEIELNPLTNPQTIIGYDEDGTKIFKLFPEGRDLTENDPVITPEDIPVVDTELSLYSKRPVENQVVTRALYRLEGAIKSIPKSVKLEMCGAIGDGVTDDSTALQTAINTAVKGCKHVFFPTKGTFYIESTLSVPDGVVIDFNHSTIEVPYDTDIPAISVNGNDVVLSNLYLKERDANNKSDSTGLLIKCSGNVKLDHVHTDGFMIGIEISAADETAIKNIKVTNCSAMNASSYGLCVSYCDGLYVENFFGCYNGLDGFKAGEHCSNVYVSGGEYSYNGISANKGGTGYGDGIDLYAGGYKFKIVSATCKGNLGAGIHIMNGSYNMEGNENYNGCVVKDVIVSGCMIENNVGNGIDAIVFHETPNAPQPQNIIFTNNCIFGNGMGVALNAIDSIVSGNIIKNSGDTGIYITNGNRVSIENNTIINSKNQGIYIRNGRNVSISKGFIAGQDMQMLRAIYLDNQSNENSTFIENVVMQNYSENCPVLVANKQTYPNTKNVIKLHKVQEDNLSNYYGFSAGSSVVLNGRTYCKNTNDINKADFYKTLMWKSSTATFTGDNSTKVFRIAHGCETTPNIFNVTPRGFEIDETPHTVKCDDTNIIVEFKEPLPAADCFVNWCVWF